MKQSKGESGMEKTKEEILSVYDPDRGGNCSFCDICRCFCDL